jgi:hypothetical protein
LLKDFINPEEALALGELWDKYNVLSPSGSIVPSEEANKEALQAVTG